MAKLKANAEGVQDENECIGIAVVHILVCKCVYGLIISINTYYKHNYLSPKETLCTYSDLSLAQFQNAKGGLD